MAHSHNLDSSLIYTDTRFYMLFNLFYGMRMGIIPVEKQEI